MAVKLAGTTVQETVQVLSGAQLGGKKVTPSDKTLVIARLVVSLLVTIVGAYLVITDQSQSQSIGAGILGAVTGYWLK